MRPTLVVLAIFLVLVPAACSAQVPEEGLARFWADFRQAVVENDASKVASMTRFPFEVRGPDDGDPVQTLDRKGFLDVYERLVVQPVHLPSGGTIVSRSMRALIAEATTSPPIDAGDPDRTHFQQFEFARIDGRWRFVRAYLEE